jgi:transposase
VTESTIRTCGPYSSLKHSRAADQSQITPARNALFVFPNKRRHRIKLLYFDATGLWVAAKRREKDCFSLPTPSEPNQRRIKLAPEALQHLFDGVDLRGPSFKL